MFTHQSAGFRAQLEDREARCIVNIEGLAVQVDDTLVETVQFVRLQLSTLDVRTLYLANIGDEAVNQLHV